ncbi:MAG: 4-hydroxy-tetrahydrodipicolinate reductase [Ruminococcus sp.]|nr:4-hydroxy-tetrahydrodipicolinate reductase [Ruminococcus sp.]
MTNIILCGCNGKMGHVVVESVSANDNCQIVCGVDAFGENDYSFPTYKDFSDIKEAADVVIDFSNPASLNSLLDYLLDKKIPAIICTTGYSPEQVEKIKSASKEVAVFYSGNMSLGVNLLIELAKQATKVLGNDFDIEIIEKHHNQKVDAPSGTALMIADGICEELEKEPQYVYDRHAYRRKRSKNEIGIHAIRGGTIVGEHDVIFAGHDEVVTISHQSQSKELFATGAVNAAIFIKGKPAGMYNMSQMLADKLK